MRLIMIAAIFFGLGNMLQAQVTVGTITGQVFDKDSATVMPFAKVYVEYEGTKSGVIADAEGKYKIDGLKPGIYTVGVTFVGKGEMRYGNVRINPDAYTFLDLVMRSDNVFEVVEVFEYKDPLIDINIQRVKISTEDISHSPNIRNPNMMLVASSSDIQMAEGTNQIIIRGSRPGDAVYFIDGIKTSEMGSFPGVAIGSMEAYTGGIPAKYGDTTGGVVILESKSYFDLYNAWLAGQ